MLLSVFFECLLLMLGLAQKANCSCCLCCCFLRLYFAVVPICFPCVLCLETLGMHQRHKGRDQKQLALLLSFVVGVGVGAPGWLFLYLLLLLSVFLVCCRFCLFSLHSLPMNLMQALGAKKGREPKLLVCYVFGCCWCWCWCGGLVFLVPSAAALCVYLWFLFLFVFLVLFLGTLGRHQGHKGRDQKHLVLLCSFVAGVGVGAQGWLFLFLLLLLSVFLVCYCFWLFSLCSLPVSLRQALGAHGVRSQTIFSTCSFVAGAGGGAKRQLLLLFSLLLSVFICCCCSWLFSLCSLLKNLSQALGAQGAR